MSQRVRRLSAAGGEERRDGDSPEETGGDLGGGEKREERRRQAQLLQIHRELQNVEVILFWAFSRLKTDVTYGTALRFCASASFHFSVSVRSEEKLAFLRPTFLEFVPRCSTLSSSAALAVHGDRLSKPRLIPIKEAQARKAR